MGEPGIFLFWFIFSHICSALDHSANFCYYNSEFDFN